MIQREPMPTFGHLKAGDPNPFVVGMEVVFDEFTGVISGSCPGPIVEVTFDDCYTQTVGYDSDGEEYTGWTPKDGSWDPISINTIFPTTQEQPAPHEYQFGDKVKVEGLTAVHYFVADTQDGFVYLSTREPRHASFESFSFQGDEISPWPEPVTVSLNCEYTATLDHGGATVGRQTFGPEVMDELTAEWLKIRGNE